jgi:Icc-related predicted phosphoesterase
MTIVTLSDTHGKHEYVDVPNADMIIYAGDMSSRGHKEEIVSFFNWFKELPHKHKICIAGNHDFFFEKANQKEVAEIIPTNVIYLNDSGVTIDGINIWGSPITPFFCDWAFNRHRGEGISKHWALIPTQTNILVTHGPVTNILDLTIYGDSVGCEDLKKVVQKIKPKYFICGHIHEAYGVFKTEHTTYFNASILNERYALKNEPLVFEY